MLVSELEIVNMVICWLGSCHSARLGSSGSGPSRCALSGRDSAGHGTVASSLRIYSLASVSDSGELILPALRFLKAEIKSYDWNLMDREKLL